MNSSAPDLNAIIRSDDISTSLRDNLRRVYGNIPQNNLTDKATALTLALYYRCEKNSNEHKNFLKSIFSLDLNAIDSNHLSSKRKNELQPVFDWLNTLVQSDTTEEKRKIKEGVIVAAKTIIIRFKDIDRKRKENESLSAAENDEWAWFLNFGLSNKSEHRKTNKITDEWAEYAKIAGYIATNTTQSNVFTQQYDNISPLSIQRTQQNNRNSYPSIPTMLATCLQRNDQRAYLFILNKLPPSHIDQFFRATLLNQEPEELIHLLSLDDTLGLYTFIRAIRAYYSRSPHENPQIINLIDSLSTTPNNLKEIATITPPTLQRIYRYSDYLETSINTLYYEGALSLLENSNNTSLDQQYSNYNTFLTTLNPDIDIPAGINQKIINHFAIKYYHQNAEFPPQKISSRVSLDTRIFLARLKLLSVLRSFQNGREGMEYVPTQLTTTSFELFRSSYLTWVFLILHALYSDPAPYQRKEWIDIFSSQKFSLTEIHNKLKTVNSNDQEVSIVMNAIQQAFFEYGQHHVGFSEYEYLNMEKQPVTRSLSSLIFTNICHSIGPEDNFFRTVQRNLINIERTSNCLSTLYRLPENIKTIAKETENFAL